MLVQVTVYSTCAPHVYARAAVAPVLVVAAEEDGYIHLVSDELIMRNFLASQQTDGIYTSVCLQDTLTGKVCMFCTVTEYSLSCF